MPVSMYMPSEISYKAPRVKRLPFTQIETNDELKYQLLLEYFGTSNTPHKS